MRNQVNLPKKSVIELNNLQLCGDISSYKTYIIQLYCLHYFLSHDICLHSLTPKLRMFECSTKLLLKLAYSIIRTP